jgi:hypothetical protein
MSDKELDARGENGIVDGQLKRLAAKEVLSEEEVKSLCEKVYFRF